MKELAFYMRDQANKKSLHEYANPWYSGKGELNNSSKTCTTAFMEAQKNSCNTKVTNDQWLKCPQGDGL